MPKFTLFALIVLAGTTFAQEPLPVVRLDEQPAYLGVSASPLNEEVRAHFKIPAEVQRGVVLTQISENTAAERAGLRAGDVVTKFAGAPTNAVEELVAAIRSRKPGDKVTYVVRRGSGTIAGTLTLGARESDPLEGPRPVPAGPRPVPEKDIDGRIDSVQRDIERLREKLLAARAEAGAEKAAKRHGFEAWIHREELAAAGARKRGDRERVRWHEARLSILREMRDAGLKLPDDRLRRIEGKLDRVLAELEKAQPRRGVRIR